jgi:hypothetical protein
MPSCLYDPEIERMSMGNYGLFGDEEVWAELAKRGNNVCSK